MPSATANETGRLRDTCWERFIHTYGTAAIFERRAGRLQRRIRLLTFLSIGVPLLVGAVAMSFGTAWAGFHWLLWAAGALIIGPVMVSLWAQISGWQAGVAYAHESSAENHRLAAEFKKLATTPSLDVAARLEHLDATNYARMQADLKYGVTPAEKRFGLRTGLSRVSRACVNCGEVPDPERPTSCIVCGE